MARGYHHTSVSGSHGAAPEFSADIGKWQLRASTLIKFDVAGQMIEFEA